MKYLCDQTDLNQISRWSHPGTYVLTIEGLIVYKWVPLESCRIFGQMWNFWLNVEFLVKCRIFGQMWNFLVKFEIFG